MPSIQDRYERTCCDCQRCKAGCRTMPASLAPGDIDTIAKHIGVEPDSEFISNNFRASLGSEVQTTRGERLAVSTIVPAQHSNGRCVFLGSRDQCTIHEVSPFGCSRFNSCDEPETEEKQDADHRREAFVKAIVSSIDYRLLWKWLKRKGKDVRPTRKGINK